MLLKADLGRWAGAVLRSVTAGGCLLGGAVIVSMGDPLVMLGALAVAIVVAGGVTWSGSRPTPVRLVLTATVLVLARVAADPTGAAIAFVLFVAGAFLHVRFSDAALGLALFAGAVSILGGADVRLLAAFSVLGAVTLALAHGAKLFSRLISLRLLARERPAVGRLARET